MIKKRTGVARRKYKMKPVSNIQGPKIISACQKTSSFKNTAPLYAIKNNHSTKQRQIILIT